MTDQKKSYLSYNTYKEITMKQRIIYYFFNKIGTFFPIVKFSSPV